MSIMPEKLHSDCHVESCPGACLDSCDLAAREWAARTWSPADGLPALDKLAEDPSPTVRFLAAANANAPRPLVCRLGADPDAMVAWAALRRASDSADWAELPFEVLADIFRKWYFTDTTELLFHLALVGLLEIREDGTVWRVAKLKMDRRRGECLIVAAEPKRAEHRIITRGYMEVSVMIAQATVACYTHRLIYRWFRGRVPLRHTVHHIDGDRSNNRLENLMMMHMAVHAKTHNGAGGRAGQVSAEEARSIVPMTAADVVTVRRLAREGMRHRRIAAMYNRTRSTISNIVARRSWKWVQEEEGEQDEQDGEDKRKRIEQG